MATRIYKRMSAGQRNKSVSDFAEITTTTPEKSLLVAKRKNGGRNASGKITVRHRGGGNRQFYRLVDFRRLKDNVQATVKTKIMKS
jgi:large subunit ribosomal protein L2